MFYSGIYLNDKNNSATIIIIEKILISAKKQYRVCHITEVLNGSSDDKLAEELKKINEDSSFIREKKVFSQSGRPPKTTRTPPVFIIAGDANREETPGEIRQKAIIIEGLLFEDNNKWHKKELRPLRYGCNYYVNPEDINETLLKACKNNRIQVDAAIPHAEELQKDMEVNIATDDCESERIKALSLSIWFCERVRQIKRY